MSAEEASSEPDIFYVAEKELADIKAKITDKKDITKEDVDRLTFPENLPDEAMMVPVDMRGVDDEFEDVEEMVEKLGPKGAAEGFVKAREYFEKNSKPDEEDTPKPMTAADWRNILEEDAMAEEGGEEDMMFEGEEEDLLEEPEEEDAEDDGEAEEPDAKKAKTD